MKNRQYIRLFEDIIKKDPIYKKYKLLTQKQEEAYHNFNYYSIFRYDSDVYEKAIKAYRKASAKVDNFLEEDCPEDNTYKQVWCDMLLEAIEKIADEKYPDVPYWVDTGSRLNVALAMLEQFKTDIKR